MENQHNLIKGYRNLTQGEIDLMNEIKALGVEIDKLLVKVDSHLHVQRDAADTACNDVEGDRIDAAEPMRWKAMARTELQTGIMKLVRAVAQPTTF